MSAELATIRLLLDDVRRRIDTGSEYLKQQLSEQSVQQLRWAEESLAQASPLVAARGTPEQQELLRLLQKELELLNQQIQRRKGNYQGPAQRLS